MSDRHCGLWSYRAIDGDTIYVDACYCNSWDCEDCRVRKARRVMWMAAAGGPQKLLTLTYPASRPETPDEAADVMQAAFTTLIRRLQRWSGRKHIAHMKFWEKTKRGYPHLHVLLRADYLPQPLIKRLWRELTGAHQVNIKAINSTSAAVAYVAKYVIKNPTRFPGHHVYDRTHDWLLDIDAEEIEHDRPPHLNYHRLQCHWRAQLSADLYGHTIVERDDGYTAYANGPPRAGPTKSPTVSAVGLQVPSTEMCRRARPETILAGDHYQQQAHTAGRPPETRTEGGSDG